jgi:nucleotide-binding universal stress UspA family protein
LKAVNQPINRGLFMETLLCPTDFSASADNAVLYADELAQRINARIILFHIIYELTAQELVSDDTGHFTRLSVDIAYEEAQRKKLEAIKSTLENTNWGLPVQYETKIKYGQTKNTIPQLVLEEHADLVVIGHEGNNGLKDIFKGSVAADIIQNSPCPVLVIPAKANFKPINKIVFATDLEGEPFTEVGYVSKLAGLFEAEILFLHVLSKPSRKKEVIAEEELNRMYKSMAYKNVSFHQITNTHMEEGISQFCQQHKADMLVMGYHPRPFWQHLFTQDYTRQIADHTYLPLLVIHYKL